MLPTQTPTIVLNNNLEFCEYLNGRYADSPYDCSNAANDTPLVLVRDFISPAGTDLTLKNLTLKFSDSASLEAIGSLTLKNVDFSSDKGCFITLGSPLSDGSQPLVIKSGRFSTSDEVVSSPICYRPTLVEPGDESNPDATTPSKPDPKAVLESVIPETSIYFSETESGTREEITEIATYIGNLRVVKGYKSEAYGFKASTFVVEDAGRGEESTSTPEPESETTADETLAIIPKTPNTGLNKASASKSQTLKTFLKNLTKIVLTRYI